MILACDVGGTKTDVALLERDDASLCIVRRQTYPSRNYGALHEIVSDFLGEDRPRLEAAGFGVAGPVRDGHAKTTNLSWTVDAERLARLLGLDRVSLLNDVEAQAWAVPHLGMGEQYSLQTGAPDGGNVAVIAAGTGLGCAALVRGAGPVRSMASEGGHSDFSPADDFELDLWRRLSREFGHVSVERVVSGPGLFSVYEALRDRDPHGESDWLASALQEGGDPSAVVASAALEGRSGLAEQAALKFLVAYGAEAGNWALRTLSTGGLWLGGGVAPRLILGPDGTPELWRKRATEAFLTRFRDKGRLSTLLEAMPVRMIVGGNGPLLGAGYAALSEAGRAVVPVEREELKGK